MTGRNLALIRERAEAGDPLAKVEWAEVEVSGRLNDVSRVVSALLDSFDAYKAALDALRPPPEQP